MIVTLTLNPSLDRTIDIASLDRGMVIRAAAARLDPGGKGVNVSRALLANGVRGCAVLPIGGDEGRQLVRLLRAEGVDVKAVPIADSLRSNITLAEPDGVITKVNEAGATLTEAELDAVADALIEVSSRHTKASWVAICGSLTPGASEHLYAELCVRLKDHGAKVAIDTSGPALKQAIAAGPDLVKPNRNELAEAVGRSLLTLKDVVEAAREVRGWGAKSVLASLGADGAMLVDDDGVLVGECAVAARRSSVGAGDAMLAGFLAAGARGADAFAEALAWGAAAVRLPGSRMPGPEDIHREPVRIHPGPDLARALVAAD